MQWEDFSRYNKERAEAEMQASTRLREAIHHTLQQTENDLEAQKVATEYAFRRRIHEFERAKDELEWQKKNVNMVIKFKENIYTHCLNIFYCLLCTKARLGYKFFQHLIQPFCWRFTFMQLRAHCCLLSLMQSSYSRHVIQSAVGPYNSNCSRLM